VGPSHGRRGAIATRGSETFVVIAVGGEADVAKRTSTQLDGDRFSPRMLPYG
jgi:hypothetical protein